MDILSNIRKVKSLFPQNGYDEINGIIDRLEELCFRGGMPGDFFDKLMRELLPFNDIQQLHIIEWLLEIVEGKRYKGNQLCEVVRAFHKEITHKKSDRREMRVRALERNELKVGICSGLTDKQLRELYDELVNAEMLKESSNIEYFVSAFNGKELIQGFEPLEWIDIPKNKQGINTQTIFQLLVSCGVCIRDDEKVIISDVKNGLRNIFGKDKLGNLNAKCRDFINGNSERQKFIDTLIKTSNLN